MDKKLAAFIAALFIVGLVAGAVIVSVAIRSTGRIKAVGISVSPSEIDWGLIGRGEQKTVAVSVANVNNTAVTLSMRVENWSPGAAADYLNLSWTGEGVVLQPAEQQWVTFTLTVADAEVPFSTFSFDIVVAAVEK